MAETDSDAPEAARVRQLETLDRLAQNFGRSLDAALTRGAASGRSLDGVLGTIGSKLAGAAARAAAGPIRSGVAGLVNAVLGAGSESEGGFARGGVFRGGRVQPFAAGGVVAAPTYFPMAGGAGLMGEAGPEAILPLARGPDGRLGVASGGAAARPVSVTVNIATPDPGAFRRSEAQVTASLARAVARGQRAT
jgi:phage-related minor tail protein